MLLTTAVAKTAATALPFLPLLQQVVVVVLLVLLLLLLLLRLTTVCAGAFTRCSLSVFSFKSVVVMVSKLKSRLLVLKT